MNYDPVRDEELIKQQIDLFEMERDKINKRMLESSVLLPLHRFNSKQVSDTNDNVFIIHMAESHWYKQNTSMMLYDANV